MIDLIEPHVSIIKNQSNDLAIFKCNFFFNYQIYVACHHYIGTWANFHQTTQKTKHIISNHVWQLWPFEMNNSNIFKNLLKFFIKLSQIMPHVTIMTIWNRWCRFFFSKISIYKIFQKCATCHNKKSWDEWLR